MAAELVKIKPDIPNQEIIEFGGPALETINKIVAYSITKSSANDRGETINYFIKAAPDYHRHLSYDCLSLKVREKDREKALEGIAVQGQNDHIASIFKANDIIIDRNTNEKHQLFYLTDRIVVMYQYNPTTQVYSMVLYPFSEDIASYLRDNPQYKISDFGTNAFGSSSSGGSRWLIDLITVCSKGIAPEKPIHN